MTFFVFSGKSRNFARLMSKTAMFLKRVSILNYKNIQEASLELSQASIVLSVITAWVRQTFLMLSITCLFAIAPIVPLMPTPSRTIRICL